MTTATTAEAFALLETSHDALIAEARNIAFLIARNSPDREVTIRDVETEMRKRHQLGDTNNFWMGPVFKKGDWVDTGRWFTSTSPSRKHHGLRPVKVWRLP